MDAPALLHKLHHGLLVALSDQASTHFTGLQQASRWWKRRLTTAQLRKLRMVDEACSLLRH
eukprot:6506492-Prorocentrum_lima.AAC.1